jgi:putative component of membrane protein insertase Oxa1/YidC/SpoIIIJ protein YidD
MAKLSVYPQISTLKCLYCYFVTKICLNFVTSNLVTHTLTHGMIMVIIRVSLESFGSPSENSI